MKIQYKLNKNSKKKQTTITCYKVRYYKYILVEILRDITNLIM